MTPAEEQLTRAKAQLILSQPFFATIALKMEFIEDNSVEKLITNGKITRYNSNYVMSLPQEKLKGALAHEVMHPALLHHTRRGGRDLTKWNKACDYAINPLLIDSGFDLPEGVYIDDQYREMPAEMIYNLLEDGENSDNEENEEEEQEDNSQGSSNPGGCGDVEDSDAESSAERQEEENEMKETVQQAMVVADRQGKMPAYLKRLIEKMLEPKVDWKEVLARFLSEIVRDDYTFSRPNPRYIHTGFFLPFLRNETIGDIILFVDTSGSINQKLLDKFGTEMQDIVNTFGKGFKVVYIDSEVSSYEDIEPDGPVDLHPSGGGGTDFKPGFEWIEKEQLNPRAVVYFTDGICSSFPETPDYPVLWSIYGHADFEPAFGEVVNIEK